MPHILRITNETTKFSSGLLQACFPNFLTKQLQFLMVDPTVVG